MRVRPSQVYKNAAILAGGMFVLFVLYSMLSDGDSPDAPAPRHSEKNLYITINKNRVDERFRALAPKRIFVWNSIFGSFDGPQVRDCPGFENRCIFDHDRSRIASADAVLFHGPDLADKNDFPPPSSRSSRQRYVFMSMESPENTFARYPPRWLWQVLGKNYFNWTMTPLFSSDVLFKYGGFWLTAKEAELLGVKVESLAVDEDKLKHKIPALFALISNCKTRSQRELALDELSKYFNVTLAGGCAKSDELRNLCPKGTSCDDEISKYAFFFAGENTACLDYISEKYWARYKLPSIPVVLRRSDYVHINLPAKSIIALDDFKSPKEMGEFLSKLARDQTAYSEYMAWRRGGYTIAPWNSEGFRNGYCRLCERLWEEQQQEAVVEDVRTWYAAESSCDDGTMVKEWVKGQ